MQSTTTAGLEWLLLLVLEGKEEWKDTMNQNNNRAKGMPQGIGVPDFVSTCLERESES